MKDVEDFNIRKERAQIVERELARIFPNELKTPLNYTKDYELLVAVVLSAQAMDKKVNEVTDSLFKKYSSLKDFADASLFELEGDISVISFYRTKARHIKKAAQMILNNYEGRVPNAMNALTSLPGVGRKTANVILGHLFNHVEGIAVDTHVIRLANKFGLVNTRDASKVEKELMALLPKKSWWEVSYRLKAYGREVSPARRKNDDPISKVLISRGLLTTD